MGDGGTSDVAALDPSRMAAWLAGPQVVDRDGRVWSWHNADHPGYPYPEAGGLWLSWAAGMRDPDDARAAAVARWLEHELTVDRIGRDGIAYTFDLGVVIRGCLEWAAHTGTTPSAVVCRGIDRLLAAIEHRVAAHPASARWSGRFGSHLGKLLFALAAIERLDAYEVVPARRVLHEALAMPATDELYLHAHAYALEGRALACVGDLDLDRELDRLAELQRPHGGLPAWWSATAGAHGPSRSDATAQALRLWAGRDRRRWAGRIAAGLGFLARMSEASGGVRYDDQSADCNTWCTLFALQAHIFAAGTPSIETLW